jgi:hypothetical protein
MKKIMICILCLAVTRGFGQVRLGIQGGATTANFWQTDGYSGLGTGLSSWPITGFTGGLIGEIDLNSSGLMIQPSLSYYVYGSHLANSAGFIDGPNFHLGYTNTMLYVYSIRLPINLVYKFSITDKWKVFGGLGPYIAKALSGTEKGYYKGDSLLPNGQYIGVEGQINNKAQISKGLSYSPGGVTRINPYDIGGDILLGVEYKKFQFAMNYSRGFTRIYRTNYVNAGNFAWNFSLAYMIFGHNKKPAL